MDILNNFFKFVPTTPTSLLIILIHTSYSLKAKTEVQVRGKS